MKHSEIPETPRIVSDVMTLTVVAVGRDAPLKEIARTMDQWEVSALPVLEGEGRVIGVVSEADLLLKEEFHERDMNLSEERQRLSDVANTGGATAKELMSTPAITVHPGTTLAQAARITAVKHVKRLPVVMSPISPASQPHRPDRKTRGDGGWQVRRPVIVRSD